MEKGKIKLVVLSVAIHKEDICANAENTRHTAHIRHTIGFILFIFSLTIIVEIFYPSVAPYTLLSL